MADSNLYSIPTVQSTYDSTSQIYAVTGTAGSYTDTRLPVAVILNNTVLTGTPVVPGYLTTALATSTYLTQANAASTYAPITGSANYAPATGSEVYATITNLALKAPLSGNLSQFSATTSAQLASIISDETGTGSLVFGTTPTVNQPNIVGVTTNSNATAGSVGEYLETSTLATSLTTGTLANATSISLTAGDWDVSGIVAFVPAGTTVTVVVIAGINTVSATAKVISGSFLNITELWPAQNTPIGSMYVNAPVTRISLSATTPVYLIAQANFSTSTMTCNGYIRARRVR